MVRKIIEGDLDLRYEKVIPEGFNPVVCCDLYLDSVKTLPQYIAITGAYELGCKDFMDENNIPYKYEDGRLTEDKPIKAKDLLPLLEKSNAYGLDKFKELIK